MTVFNKNNFVRFFTLLLLAFGAVLFLSGHFEKAYACSCDCTYVDSCTSGKSPAEGCAFSSHKNLCTGSGTLLTCSDGGTRCVYGSGSTCRSRDWYCSGGRCGVAAPVYNITCTECGCTETGGGGCFTALTKVTMYNGDEKNIEDIESGDLITTFNTNGEEVVDEVIELEEEIFDGYYVVLLSDGTKLEVTDNHPLWAKIDNYIGWGSLDPLMTKIIDKRDVKKVRVGDFLYKGNDAWVEIVAKQYTPGNLSVYNLKLKGYGHTYLANGILVHNKGEDPPPPTNHAPTAYFTSAPTPVKAGTSYNYSATARDSDSNLSSMSLHRTRPGVQSWVSIGAVASCSGGSCDITRPWTPVFSDIGNWAFAVNAYDSGGAKCTGNWTVTSPWTDCDSNPNDGTTDSPAVCVYLCPVNRITSDAAYYSELRLSRPANGERVSSSNSASFSWPTVNFGSVCSATKLDSLRLEYRVLGESAVSSRNISPVSSLTTEISGLQSNTTYEWRLVAGNGQCTTSSSWWEFTTNYEQPNTGWFTSVDGDVYGTTIRLKGPASGAPIGGDFGPSPAKLAYGVGSVFSGAEISFSPSSTLTAAGNGSLVSTNILLESDGGWMENLENLNSSSITGNAGEKITITSSNYSSVIHNLDPKKVYVVEDPGLFTSCPGGVCGYNLSASGVALVYYLPGNTNDALSISSDFKHVNSHISNEKVLFISNSDILISKDIETVNSVKDSPANLEFGIVTSGQVIFEGSSTVSEIPTELDNPVVVDGSIIASSIEFNRLTQYNSYPGAVVQYNPVYLKGLFDTATLPSYNPLLFKSMFVSEVYWGETN